MMRTPHLDLVGSTLYVGFQSAFDSFTVGTSPPPRRDRRARILLLVAVVRDMLHLKRAVSRVAEGETAFGKRTDELILHVITRWSERNERGTWYAATMSPKLTRLSTGAGVGSSRWFGFSRGADDDVFLESTFRPRRP
jgi:hypothetical protein